MVGSRFSLSLLSLASLFVSSDCTAAELPRSLTPEESLQYIDEADFRARVALEGGLPVRLNLGQQFKSYMTNAAFRERVLAVVDKERIWSDVSSLDLKGERSQVLDLSYLTGLVNVWKLTVCGHLTQIVNLGALGRLTSLVDLQLGDAGVQDVTALATLVNLRTFSVHNTQLYGLGALSRLPRLQTLLLSGRLETHNINDLAGFQNLTSLRLFGSNLQGLGALSQLTRLRELEVQSRNGIIDMNDLVGCGYLDKLTLYFANFRNLNAFCQSSPNLLMLELDAQTGSDALDFHDLAGCLRLRELKLRGLNVQNVNELSQLRSLSRLTVNNRFYANVSVFIEEMRPYDFPAHAETALTARMLPDDRECCICDEAVENVDDCLLTCSRSKAFHGNCLRKWQRLSPHGTCPHCRTPLGPLP